MRFPLLPAFLACALISFSAEATPVINEIMYHPLSAAGSPEDTGKEWIELYNNSATTVDLSGWKLSKGVEFTFAPGTQLAAGGYLVVAADVTKFQAEHPGFTSPLVGPWTGRLSNTGENIRLDDALGQKVDEVTYADEGDWALRARGVTDRLHNGWMWVSDSDGNGNTLELRNPALSTFDCGQNWAQSAAVGGTPGAANGAASADIAPLIQSVRHEPRIPRSTDPIRVSARITDESGSDTATLSWRVAGAATWNSLTMSDSDGDGDRDATIPPQANLAILEFYVQASDGTNTRTWPAPARTSLPGVTPETFAQSVNALLQVDNTYNSSVAWVPGSQPIYRVIMTPAERTELGQIWSNAGSAAQSNAAMNATFISVDGTGEKVRYLCHVRNRGNGSRTGPPNNSEVSVPSDNLWNNRQNIALNCRYAHSQVLGALLMERMGAAVQEGTPVQVRYNGSNLAESTARMYGSYARIEPLASDWVSHHFPDDSEGNLYQIRDSGTDPTGGNLRWEGSDPLAYQDSYFKQSNSDAADWSDIVALCDKLNNTPAGAGYRQTISTVVDLDEWLNFLAANALIGNREGGISTGRGDDYSIYRGVVDPRFKLVPHDLDTTMSFGDVAAAPAASIISSYELLPGLGRILNDPDILPDYYSKVLDLMDRVFNPTVVNPLIEQAIGYVPQAARDAAKNFVVNRRAGVLAQIPQTYSLTVSGTGLNVDGFPQTTDGSATISGTFNVAKVRSILVNGTPATMYQRTVGTNLVGSWTLPVAANSGFLQRGVNQIVVKFYDGLNGAGNALQTLTAGVFYPGAATPVSGTLQPGSLRLTAPDSYIPGRPFLVRVDQLDAQGNVNRSAWNTSVALTAGGTGALPTVTLYNGVGSALVSLGGAAQQPDETIIPKGSSWLYLDNGTDQGTAWRAKDFPAEASAPWKSGPGELGVGDGDEATVLAQNPTGSVPWTTYYFRKHFTLPTPLPSYAAMKIHMRCDDGAIVYVNGTQAVITRGMTANMAASAFCTFNRTTTSSPNENTFEEYVIPLGLLVAGDNTIAVEVHNNAASSPDISFETDLIASYPSPDPGAVTLTAKGGGFAATKAMASLGNTPATTDASGTLAGDTTWSGVVNVTSDVTVPAGITLTIAPGTQIFMAGTAAAGDATGAKLIIQGTLNANGTAAQPINLTCADTNARWGQILFNNAAPSTLNYVLLSHAGHAPGVGHTGKGPMLRLTGSSVSIIDSVIADGSAKAIYSSGTCDVVLRRSLINRMVTGPELEDGCSLLVEDSNIQQILPDFRDSSAPAPDDEDCLYVHNSTGKPVTVRRSVFARCGDDLFDCLAGPITVEDSILREAWDKGMSLLNNDLTISRTLIVDCDKAIVPKSNAAVTRTIKVDRVTIVSEDHDTSQSPWGYSVAPSNPDPDTASTGLYTQNKAGQSNTGATISITATNCIIEAKEPVKVDVPYSAANTVVTYTDMLDLDTPGATAWPGTGNGVADPLFVNLAAKDFHLQSTSPCRDAGDPAAALDADGSRADMGALAFATSATSGVVTWTAAGGPYRITDNLVIPIGLTLVIQGGTSVWVDEGRTITANGILKVQGTENAHVVFSHPPGTSASGDADPIVPGVQTGAPKWGGLRIVGPGSPLPMSTGHEVLYADFINAQPAVAAGNQGSLGIIRAEALVDHCTFTGTHLRQLYGKNCSLTVQNCVFPDEFNPADVNDNPVALSLDNIAEPLKVEMPDPASGTNPELLNNPNYVLGMPVGGHWRVYYNHFYGNKGHNDVFDADSGRWGQTQILDCRYNWFHGLTGDEHIDLGGDAYIASNIFERGAKDQWTSDHGYANAISSGDKGTGTTIWVVRNVAFDLDHVMNCKVRTGTIFEHNTVANLHADFHYAAGPPFNIDQDVKCSAINLFIPDDTAPQSGDGGYAAFNIFDNLPRVVSWADLPSGTTSKLEVTNNYLNNVADLTVGTKHTGGLLSLGAGNVQPGSPGFINAAAKNFALAVDSAARGSAPGGLDYGATIPEWAYIVGEPPAQTSSSSATFTVGGPGIVAFKWRLDGGAWSNPVQIGSGGVFSRTSATQRTATVQLTSLSNGPHIFEVLGQDAAGNWQDSDPAKTALQQAAPTAKSWTVNTSLQPVRINEVLADSTTLPDTVELYNAGSVDLSLAGWSLSDDPAQRGKYLFASNVVIPAGGYLVVPLSAATFQLDKDGDAVYLFDSGTGAARDSVVFGHQVKDLTIGRVGASGSWTLCLPTLGTVNTPQRLGDPAGLRINEWLAKGDVLYSSDWVELANTAALPVALGGLRLTDNAVSSPASQLIAPLSFIAGNGFLKFIADGNPSAGPTHLGFTLDSEQEQIVLFNGSTQLDHVNFYSQTADFSMGRDGATTTGYNFYELPTAALPNGTSDPAYANGLALLRGLRITELMYDPVGGSDYEFVELRNVGTTPLQLNGVRFVQGIDFVFGDLTLNAGQNVVVVSNLAKFRSRYGAAVNVAGVYTGKLDNSGEILAIQLPPPFDANILTFAYSDTWQATANGLGKSLVVLNAGANANTWGNRQTWTYSASVGGEPGGVTIAAPDHFVPWLAYFGIGNTTADGDADGLAPVVEYALGANPSPAFDLDGAVVAPTLGMAADGRLELRFKAPENPASVQGHGPADLVYVVEASSDLVTWTAVATKTPSTSWTGPGTVIPGISANGLVSITVRDSAVGGATRYMRLRATLAQ